MKKKSNLKRNLLWVALAIAGLNTFTACYGMPPGDWQEPIPEDMSAVVSEPENVVEHGSAADQLEEGAAEEAQE